jgi:uracil-DNA glycosylase
MVFLLWGGFATKKTELIDTKKHRVLTAAHPSPLSAKKFFGSKPFSTCNAALKELGKAPVDWQLPTDPNADDPGAKSAAASAPAAAKAAAPAPAPASSASAARLAPAVRAAPAAPPLPTYAVLKGVNTLSASWLQALGDEVGKLGALDKFLESERKASMHFVPSDELIFRSLVLTPFERVKAVIVGNEPPCVAKDADGLAWSQPQSVRGTVTQNIIKELRDDLGLYKPTSGSLVPWAKDGVLLLNSVLTVRTNKPGSHAGKGWENFTDAVLKALNARPRPVAFLLWGSAAQKKQRLLDEKKHIVLASPGPDEDGFLGSKPFSRCNTALELRGQSAVYWQLFAL